MLLKWASWLVLVRLEESLVSNFKSSGLPGLYFKSSSSARVEEMGSLHLYNPYTLTIINVID